jgi:hypothetical protein
LVFRKIFPRRLRIAVLDVATFAASSAKGGGFLRAEPSLSEPSAAFRKNAFVRRVDPTERVNRKYTPNRFYCKRGGGVFVDVFSTFFLLASGIGSGALRTDVRRRFVARVGASCA